MSTQKKESIPVKGQTRNNEPQRKSTEATAQKGKVPGAQQKPKADGQGNPDRKPTNERGNDSKRPNMNNKKN